MQRCVYGRERDTSLKPIEILKIIGLLIYHVCAIVCNKISQCRKLRDVYFFDEVETQLREKPLWGSQTQDIHYSKDKTRYKIVTLTYP